MTTPDQVRTGLQTVTAAAATDLRSVAQSAPEASAESRSLLFAATPLIVSDYIDGSAALALDWFEELREAAEPPTPYRPVPLTLVTEEQVSTSVAVATKPLYEIETGVDRDPAEAFGQAVTNLEIEIQRLVAAGFWDTMTGNATADPDAVGWQRFARAGACKFCTMLADRGAVYSEASVHFAAHGNCSCVVGQSYDPSAPRANVMQYVASRRNRSEADRARLREYLNQHYAD